MNTALKTKLESDDYKLALYAHGLQAFNQTAYAKDQQQASFVDKEVYCASNFGVTCTNPPQLCNDPYFYTFNERPASAEYFKHWYVNTWNEIPFLQNEIDVFFKSSDLFPFPTPEFQVLIPMQRVWSMITWNIAACQAQLTNCGLSFDGMVLSLGLKRRVGDRWELEELTHPRFIHRATTAEDLKWD